VRRGAEKDDVINVKAILSKNANLIHARDKNGQTVLHIAARAAKLKTVKVLIDAGADVNSVDAFGKERARNNFCIWRRIFVSIQGTECGA